jgi:hypothetical protein
MASKNPQTFYITPGDDGFLVGDRCDSYGRVFSCFSSLDETLEFLRKKLSAAEGPEPCKECGAVVLEEGG